MITTSQPYQGVAEEVEHQSPGLGGLVGQPREAKVSALPQAHRRRPPCVLLRPDHDRLAHLAWEAIMHAIELAQADPAWAGRLAVGYLPAFGSADR
jgi:hypothetical protein